MTKITEQDKRHIIAFERLGFNEHETAVDFFSRKHPIKYAHIRKLILKYMEEREK